MAAAIAGHSLSFAWRRPLSASGPHQTLEPTFLPVRPNPSCKCVPLPRILSSSGFPRRSFEAFVNVADSSSETINGDEVSQTSANFNKYNVPPMKILIQKYKKAIIDGDEKSAHEIEALMCILEDKKNNLSKNFAEMTTEIAFGKDKFLRLKADLENFRKQTEKDRLKFTSDIRADLIEDFLTIVDIFEKTKKEIKLGTEKEKNIENSYQGIYKQFVETLRSLGVSAIETVSKPFDPAIHEVVAREESEQFKAGIVSQELSRGFMLGDRLLRSATVKVSSGGPVQVNPNSDGSVEVKSVGDSNRTRSNK